MRPVDHTAKKIQDDIAKKSAVKDYSEAMREYRDYRLGNEDKISNEASIAFGIHESRRQSEIIEALLLSGCPREEIQDAFNVPVKSVDFYAELFYDLGVFRTDLDRLEYLEDYPDATGRDLKLKAVSLGYEFVLFNFANLVPKTVAQKKLVERMFMATAYKAMSMNYNGIKSETNKQAIRHAELMIRAYELLNKINADDGQETYDLVNLLVSEDIASQPEKPGQEEII